MAVRKALLLIADIGGYTKFMTLHRVNLAHAQDVVAQLLEAVIDASRPHLKLAKLEGDAALFHAPLADEGADEARVAELVTRIHLAFRARRERMRLDRLCTCDGCVQSDQLRLKFVVHAGEVAEQKVKRHRELAGVDVILVHRMLKNGVPAQEYVLMTEPVFQRASPELRANAVAREEEFEGLGATKVWYVDLATVPAPPLPAPVPASGPAKIWALVRRNARSLPYILGLRTSCDGFRNMGEVLPALPAPERS